MDNAPSHPLPKVLEIETFRVIFLPQNITSLIQPLDQGAIETLKRYYHKHFLSSVFENSEEGSMLTVIEH